MNEGYKTTKIYDIDLIGNNSPTSDIDSNQALTSEYSVATQTSAFYGLDNK